MATLGPTKWHEIVSSLINECMTDDSSGGGCTKQDIQEAAASMPFLIDVRGALGDVDSTNSANNDASKLLVGQAIISDGNDWFIDAYLKRNGMEHYFTHGVETNLGIWEKDFKQNANEISSGSFCSSISNTDHEINSSNESNENTSNQYGDKFRIQYQSTKYGDRGHSCKRCPPNLCKSQVVANILSRTRAQSSNSAFQNSTNGNESLPANNRPRIVYIGDGSNDACPALNILNNHDILLARAGRKRRDPNSKTGPESDGDSKEGHGKHEYHPEMHARELEAHGAVNAFPILSTLRKAEKNEGLVPKCRVRVWRSGKELRSLIRGILDETMQGYGSG